MKQYIGLFIFIIGLLFTVGGPFYQLIDSMAKNIDGDGKTVYGDNFLFKNILGVKTTYSDFIPGYGWETTEENQVQTTAWMQEIGLPETVTCYRDYSSYELVYSEGYWGVFWARTGVKLIPILFILIGLRLATSSKSFFISWRLGIILTPQYFPCNVVKIL